MQFQKKCGLILRPSQFCWCQHFFCKDIIVNFFSRFFFLFFFIFDVSLVKFSYQSKFQFNIISGSEIMTIYFSKGLTRNPEMGNTPSEFFPISGDWSKLGIANLGWMFLINFYEKLQYSRVTDFTVSELLRQNQQREGL